MNILGIDVGGSGIKGAIVNTLNGELVSDRIRIITPNPASPESISNVIKSICNKNNWKGPVGVSFPTIVKNGKAMHFGNLDHSCQGVQLDKLFKSKIGNEFFVLNDADAAAMAVMEFGEGKNKKGLVITITIGTGIGSGAFFNGKLMSNFELGRIYGRKGDIMEHFASDAARKRNDWDFKKWGKRINFFLNHLEKSFSPDLIIIGGGISKRMNLFENYIKINTPILPAKLKNNAGIVGAAIFAKRNFTI
tara:strand:+ start:2280 stop:3026 length:747 start_codon:yes stop_codon:yes gene_type:complete